MRHNINNVMDLAHGDVELDIMATDDEIKTTNKRTVKSMARPRKKVTKKKQ